MTAPRLLSEVERSQILRQVIDTKVISQQGTATQVNTTGYVTYLGGMVNPVSTTSSVTSRRTGPFVKQWGTTWAVVAFGNWLWHPAVIAMRAVVSFFYVWLVPALVVLSHLQEATALHARHQRVRLRVMDAASDTTRAGDSALRSACRACHLGIHGAGHTRRAWTSGEPAMSKPLAIATFIGLCLLYPWFVSTVPLPK